MSGDHVYRALYTGFDDYGEEIHRDGNDFLEDQRPERGDGNVHPEVDGTDDDGIGRQLSAFHPTGREAGIVLPGEPDGITGGEPVATIQHLSDR